MKPGKAIWILIWLLALAVFVFSAYQVIDYTLDRTASRQIQNELIEQAVTVKTASEEPEASAPPVVGLNSAAPEITSSAESSAAPGQTETPGLTAAASPEPTAAAPMETSPVEVDFDALTKRSRAVRAWIYLEGTPINYPVAQGEDNSYYLDHLITGKSNDSGALFMDYRNAADFSDPNTIIYGHNMKNGSMFGLLPYYMDQEFYDTHPAFYLVTPDQAYKAEVFAGYVTASDSDVYQFVHTPEERDRLIRGAIAQSVFAADVEIGADDRIVTLSTCTYAYDNARFVLLGVLRELADADALHPQR